MKVVNTFVNLVLLAGATLMLILLVLSGSVDHFPFNRFYWVRADTSAITNAYDQSAWTFWGVCQYGNFSSCHSGPAYPISPVDNFHTTTGVPEDFIDNRDTYYYLTRFSFAFFLLGLGFCAFSLIISVLGFCFQVIDKVLVFLVVVALFFVTGAACFQTAANVLARNAFKDDSMRPHLGVKLMALAWAIVACMLLVFFFTCAANIANSYRKHIQRVNEAKEYDSDYYSQDKQTETGALGDESSFTRTAAPEKNETESGGIRFFRIKRNQKPSDDDESV